MMAQKVVHYGPGGDWYNARRIVRVDVGVPVCPTWLHIGSARVSRDGVGVTCKRCLTFIRRYKRADAGWASRVLA